MTNTDPRRWTRDNAAELTDAEYDLADQIVTALEARDARRAAAGKAADPWVTPSYIARLAREDLSHVRPVLDWMADPARLMSVISDGASPGIRRFRLK
jgi:hypothetical protein